MTGSAFFSLASWITAHGYIFMFGGMFLEGPLITAAASFGAALGYFNLPLIIALSTLADISADLVYYGIGYFSRGAALKRFSKRLTPERLAQLDRVVHMHGSKAIAILKYTPLLPLPGFILLGAAHLNVWRFALVCILSTIPRTILFVIIGYYAGYFFSHYSRYLAHSELILFICAVVVVGLVVLYTKITNAITKRFLESV